MKKKILLAVLVAGLFFVNAGTAMAQEPVVITRTLGIWWDVSTEITTTVPADDVINQVVAELRDEAGTVEDWVTTSVPDCVPRTEEPGIGRCGSAITYALTIPGPGTWNLCLRGVWIELTDPPNTLAFLEPDPLPADGPDADNFWCVEQIVIEEPQWRYLFPLMYKNAPVY